MQEITKDTVKPLSEGSNKVRPFDKVKITWTGGKHIAAGTETEEHPVFAAKMVEAGKASYSDGSAPAAGKKSSKKQEEVK